MLFSQEEESQEPKVQRFKEIIISADEVLEVKGGEKRRSNGVPSLSSVDLDSLNSLEKKQSILLPPAGLPKNILKQADDMAYVRSSAGRFTTIDAEAGYAFAYKDFDIYTKADLELSSGHLENANYSNFGAHFISDYTADKKFWIFGGSKTRTRFDYNNQNYNTFSVFDPENRSMDSIAIMMDVDGNYNGFLFKTGLGFDLLSLGSEIGDFTDSGIKGFLNITNPLNKYRFGVNTFAELRSGNDQSNNYFESVAFIKYISRSFDLNLSGGVQLAQDTTNTIFAPTVLASLDFKTGKLFSLNLYGGTGIGRNTFANMFRVNPYMAWNSYLDHTRERLYVGGKFSFHGKRVYSVNLGARFSVVDNYLNWVFQDSTSFTTLYDSGTILNINLDGFYDLNEKNTISGGFNFNVVSSDSLDAFTYLPNVEIFTDYRLKLIDNLVLSVGMDLIGTRFAGSNGTFKLDPFINLRFNADYLLTDKLSFNINSENLLDQDIYTFQNYRQRGIYASFGFLWKF